jgi:putative phage-type endonuclease
MGEAALLDSIKDRTKGIGGSDMHHLFNLKPHGCARRLYYEKQGIEADYPFLGNNATERGNKLEDIAAKEYAEKTGRKLRKSYQCFRRGTWAAAHIDRKIIQNENGRGVLEIKVPGERMFNQIKYNGLPEAYILQLQHYLLVTGWEWGGYCIFWADGWKLLDFDVERNETLIKEISSAGIAFWQDVKNGNEPERLPDTDSRCGKCPWRVKCQGQHILDAVEDDREEIEYDESMEKVVEEYLQAKEIFSEAEEYLEDVKARIKGALGKRIAVQAFGSNIYYRPVISRRWNTKLLEKDHPELAEKYKKEQISRPLKVYEISI